VTVVGAGVTVVGAGVTVVGAGVVRMGTCWYGLFMPVESLGSLGPLLLVGMPAFCSHGRSPKPTACEADADDAAATVRSNQQKRILIWCWVRRFSKLVTWEEGGRLQSER
jgi:hypothetical protein